MDASRLRIVLVVQRYGKEVNGGAESLCRFLAGRLAARYSVEVWTTCARDHADWSNHYAQGTTLIDGVVVRRFPVNQLRHENFGEYSSWIFCTPHHLADEYRWVEMQGPHSPKLLEYLQSAHSKNSLFIFFTYLYSPTVFGMPQVASRSVLVPTAHDEPPLYLDLYQRIFRLPRHLIYNTDEEGALVNRVFSGMQSEGTVVGSGIERAPAYSGWLPSMEFPVDNRKILLYVGRIEPAKGCDELIQWFQSYAARPESQAVTLVLVGRTSFPIPQHPRIYHLGFLSEQHKWDMYHISDAVIVPSRYESFSLTTLEAWSTERPVLVNGRCSVTTGHCKRSGGGLWYNNYAEFCECLDAVLGSPELRRKLASAGQEYVFQHYTWDRVIEKYSQVIERFATANILTGP